MSELDRLLKQLQSPSLPEIDLSLARMVRALALLGDPQTRVPPVIHVAGTNGKGSTIAFLRAMFEAAGKRAHVYTSPHLVRFNERIVLAGEEISDAELIRHLERVAEVARDVPMTYFEATTAAAFLAFAAHEADVLLLEVGLGGKLDATNVVTPVASVITSIGIDHTEFLGPSLSGIAGEKAGIIKRNVPVFTVPQREEAAAVIRGRAEALGAKLHVVGPEAALPEPALPGVHQRVNASLAAAVARAVGLKEKDVRRGIVHARWPARLQKLTHGPLAEAWRGEIFLDGAHNEAAAREIAGWMRARKTRVHLLVGMMRRKDAVSFFRPFAGVAAGVACIAIPGHADSFTAEELAKAAREAGIADAFAASSAAEGLSRLGAQAKGDVLVTGSLFLAGEILKTHG